LFSTGVPGAISKSWLLSGVGYIGCCLVSSSILKSGRGIIGAGENIGAGFHIGIWLKLLGGTINIKYPP